MHPSEEEVGVDEEFDEEDLGEEDVERILDEITGGGRRGDRRVSGKGRGGFEEQAEEEVEEPGRRQGWDRYDAERRYRTRLGQHQALALMLELSYLEKNEGYNGPQIMQACFLLHPAASARSLPVKKAEGKRGGVKFTGNLGRLVGMLREGGFTVKSCGGIPVC